MKLLDELIPARHIRPVVISGGPAKDCTLRLDMTKRHKAMREGTFEGFIYDGLGDLTGKVVWDIGAWIGYHSLCFANLGADVYSFEPGHKTYIELSRTIGLNSRLRIMPRNCALSNYDGVSQYYARNDFYGEGTGNHLEGMKGNEKSTGNTHYDVQVHRGDTLVSSGIPRPNIIKLDAEGSELNVLDGLGCLLKRHPLIFLEAHSPKLRIDCVSYLWQEGYNCVVLKDESPDRIYLKAVG